MYKPLTSISRMRPWIGGPPPIETRRPPLRTIVAAVAIPAAMLVPGAVVWTSPPRPIPATVPRSATVAATYWTPPARGIVLAFGPHRVGPAVQVPRNPAVVSRDFRLWPRGSVLRTGPQRTAPAPQFPRAPVFAFRDFRHWPRGVVVRIGPRREAVAGTDLPAGCRTGFTFANDGVWNFTVDCDDA